jgi:hypothetical protein
LRCADETLQVVRYDAGPGDIIAEGATSPYASRRCCDRCCRRLPLPKSE